MFRLRKFTLVAFIALLVVLPLHEVVDPGEQLPFDDEVVAVVFSALFIAAASLSCRGWGSGLFLLVQAAARRRMRPLRTAALRIPSIEPPRDQSSARLVLCQFRI